MVDWESLNQDLNLPGRIFPVLRLYFLYDSISGIVSKALAWHHGYRVLLVYYIWVASV